MINNNPSILLKAESLIKNVSMQTILEQLCDQQKREQWDIVLAGIKLIERINEYTDIIYYYIKSPNTFLVDHRSFCVIRMIRHDFPSQGDVSIMIRSVEHQNCPVEKKNFVRAENILSGYIITQMGKDCKFKLISQVDIKVLFSIIQGNIPIKLVNKMSQKAPQDWIENLISACENQKE